MNLRRAIGGVLLSFAFLSFFACIIFATRLVFDNYLTKSDKDFYASLSGSLNSVEGSVNKPEETTLKSQDLSNDNQTNQVGEISLNAQSAISISVDLSGQDKVVFSKNSQRKLSIASISKLMTALVVVDNYNLSQEITISGVAAHQSTDPDPLKEGETYYLKDLLYAMLVGSDNTASYALSEFIGEDKFIGLMNTTAQDIGLTDTSFTNPTGLGFGNYSTTQDLAKLAKYLLENHPSIFGITKTRETYLYTVDSKISNKIISTDELLSDSFNLGGRIIGGKTGDTRTAGGCLLLVAKSADDNGYLINVILNSNDRFGEMKKLIGWSDSFPSNEK